VASAGVGLVRAPPGRPAQRVGDGGGLAAVVIAAGVEESAYFGEGECDQAAAFRFGGVGFGRVGWWIVV